MDNPSNNRPSIPSVLIEPMYTTSEAARLAGMTPQRVRRWIRGYEYSWSVKNDEHKRFGSQAPIIQGHPPKNYPYISFLQLIELVFIRRFLENGISLPRMRELMKEAKDRLGTPTFAHQIFFIQGRSVFLRLRAEDIILKLGTEGQLAIEEIIEALAIRIEFDESTKLARRWYPFLPEGQIVIDPAIAFGHPTINGRRITTTKVYDLYRGEKKEINAVCRWMDITPSQAKAAIQFEEKLAA